MSTRRFVARNSEFDAIRVFVEANAGVMAHDDQYRVLLLVEELFANSVMHGYAGESESPVWLTIDVSGGVCRIIYEDEAREYDPFAGGHQPQLEGTVEDRPVGGIGIMLLTEMSSSHSYARRDGRNVIEFQVPLGPGPGSAISV